MELTQYITSLKALSIGPVDSVEGPASAVSNGVGGSMNWDKVLTQ